MASREEIESVLAKIRSNRNLWKLSPRRKIC